MQNLFADLRRGSGAAIISSAGGAEYALESPAGKQTPTSRRGSLEFDFAIY